MSFNEHADAFDTLMKDYMPDDSGDNQEVPTEEAPEDDGDGEDSAAAQEDEAPTEETNPPEDDGEANPDEDGSEDEHEDDQEHKKGKKSARERINEVVAQRRAAERERDAEKAAREALEARIAALEAGKDEKPKTPVKDVAPAGAEFGIPEPTVDDVDDSGESKYPLGEFDPKYIRDLGRYDRAVERAYEAKVAAENAARTAAQQEADVLFTEWDKKLTAAEKTSPTIRQKAANLVDTFADVPAEHGQALAQAIMTLDNGPAVLEYLADNLDEADEIIQLPVARGMIRLGKLDALFVEDHVETAPPVKQTKAPPPPSALARGRGTSTSGGPNTLYDKMLKDFR